MNKKDDTRKSRHESATATHHRHVLWRATPPAKRHRFHRIPRFWCLTLIAIGLASALPSGVVQAEPDANGNPAANHGGMPGQASEAGGVQAEGEVLLRRMAEVNRYWLSGPPETVRGFSYTHSRGTDEGRSFDVTDPRAANADLLCGVTYKTAMRALARDPARATITELVEEDGRVRMGFRFDPMLKGACGNGLAGRWYGYFNLGVTSGMLWLDRERLVPLELRTENLRETFGEYVPVDDGHYVPLNIQIYREKPRDSTWHFDWRFRLYDPGLWLLDVSRYARGDGDSTTAAQVSDVSVNGRVAADGKGSPIPTMLLAESPEAAALRDAQSRGQQFAEVLVDANRAWLLPSLDKRRGLAYDYRQEGHYRERVLFDGDGRIMVELEGTKEGPEAPTRQWLYLPEGTMVTANAGDRYVSEKQVDTDAGFKDSPALLSDRHVQNLVVGLGWDCALARLAREPQDFLVEKAEGKNGSTYRLILRPRGDARLFTGTMLVFTSWAYMHDVRYQRSEIDCDAQTHRPLEERDFDGEGKLVGRYRFRDYKAGGSGAAPTRIEALVPYEKDGEDHGLEMTATFRVTPAGLWFLERVHSAFRGGDGDSTGTVQFVDAKPAYFAPIEELFERLENTRTVLHNLEEAPEGRRKVPYKPGEVVPVWARGTWRTKDNDGIIAIRDARIDETADGTLTLQVNLLSTAYWKVYSVKLRTQILDDTNAQIVSGETTGSIKAEGTIGEASISLDLDPRDYPATATSVALELLVERLTGQYHGHGMWFSFMSEEQIPDIYPAHTHRSTPDP